MSDAKSIVEAVTYRALAAAIAGATVWQDAPRDAQGDLVIIGDLKSFRPSLKETGGDRRVEIAIVSLVEAEERAPLLRLQAQIEAILDEQNFELDGWTVEFLFQDDDAVLNQDGTSYSGVSSFVVTAIAP